MARTAIYSGGLFPEVCGYRDEVMSVEICDDKEADSKIVEHHYSGKRTPNRFMSLSVNGGMGYMQLGYGIRPKMKHTISENIASGNFCEFDRMWMSDELPKNSESKAISLMLDFLRVARPEIKYVITYADESVGNRGTIYRASNAVYVGSIPCDFFVLQSGERVHPVTMYHRHGTRSKKALEKIYPGIRHIWRTFKQRRFVYPMDRYARRDIEKRRVDYDAE